MITVEDKLNIFYKMVLEREKESFEKILDEIEEKNKIALDEHKNKVSLKRDEMIEKKKKSGKIMKEQKISQAIVETRQKIFRKKEELLEDLLLSIKEKSKVFVCSKEYENYLLRELESILNEVEGKNIVLYLKLEDNKKYGDSIINLANKLNIKITFKEANENIVGGFLIFDEDKTYLIDETFKIKIEENKYLVGEKLYETLEKAGDILD
ncbi:V-type ATP synthase subunit E [Sporanaerobacter acetigenes]|uniref:H+-ATPase subunit E/Vma4 n=1 Tax=Sporanaerobacter acetigenes DSM 13106 TaxID=1123281 RepID=A0A1M5VUP6_9FIRM|nr:V-type ATP synthase subunit E family protein [Sporanaerobacter acetigenes]SHH78927.1 H+-ATPase subunit E/Vma4 [Sporanaerobacter acetigenes DSM 13106]